MSHLIEMMEQLKKLKNGLGIQGLLDGAYEVLGNPIAMYNTEYALLAHNDLCTDDPVWNELLLNGAFGKETQLLYNDEGFIEEVANSSKTVLLKSDKLLYDRLTGKIFNKNNTHVSSLMMVGCNKPFDDDDTVVFEAVCKLISKEISTSDEYQEYEQTHLENTIKNLIDGSYDKKLDMSQVGILYDSLESNLFAVVVDISLCSPAHNGVVHYRDMLRQAKPSYLYAVYDGRVVIIVSAKDEVLNVGSQLSGLIAEFENHNMYAGISDKFENLFELQKHYNQALSAMEYAYDTRSTQRIYPCDTASLHKMEQINELVNGEGIQYFLNKGAEIFGNPLLFHDMELNLLGYTENMEISDPIWQELITYGTSSNETIELFRTEGFVDTMDNTKSGAILVSDKIQYDRISWRIYNSENIRIGCTSIVNTMKPFSEDELVLFGVFSQRFSKEVGTLEFYDNYGQVYSGTIINRLISGKIDDYTFYSEDIGNLYDKLMDNLYLVAVDMTLCGREQANLPYFRSLFSWPGTVSRYAFYSKYIIILISMDCTPPSGHVEIDRLNAVFEQHNIYAGVSSCFDDVYNLPKYYKEAVDALNAGIKKGKDHGKHRMLQRDISCPQP